MTPGFYQTIQQQHGSIPCGIRDAANHPLTPIARPARKCLRADEFGVAYGMKSLNPNRRGGRSDHAGQFRCAVVGQQQAVLTAAGDAEFQQALAKHVSQAFLTGFTG